MRTTLSLDEDVARLLQKEARRSGASFKKVVNDFLRAGLAASKQPSHKAFIVTPRGLGLSPGLSYDNVGELIETLEGPEHR